MATIPYADFSAGDSLLGYIYQCEYALFHLLDRDNPTVQISIETLDDVVFGNLSDPEALLQLKLHAVNGDGKVRSLTDRSPDLWKTLRVWATLVHGGRIKPAKTTFFLMTTSPLSQQPSVAHLLGPREGEKDRNIVLANQTLQELAANILGDPDLSTKSPLIKGASALLALAPSLRLELVRNIVIVTGTPTILDLRKKIESRLRAGGSTQETHQQFVETVVGWWYGRCVEQIAAKDERTISFDALERKMAETAKALALPNLPRYEALEEPIGAELTELIGRLFVHQLQALGLQDTSVLVRTAMVDFYKADGHRKRWLEELRLDQKELAAFESDLKSAWAVNFGVAETEVDLCAKCPDPDVALQRLGLRVLKETMNAAVPRLKGFEAEYLAKGSYHILANGPKIGWHPHWQALFGSTDRT